MRYLNDSYHFIVVVSLIFSVIVARKIKVQTAVDPIEIDLVYVHGVGYGPHAMDLLAQKVGKSIDTKLSRYLTAVPNLTIGFKSGIVDLYPELGDKTVGRDGPEWRGVLTNKVLNTFPYSHNIVLIGFSAGGKASVEVAARPKYLQDRTKAVITINAPIKPIAKYSLLPSYWRFLCTLANGRNFCQYIGYESSEEDAKWVATHKRLLTLRSRDNRDNILLYKGPSDGRVPYDAQGTVSGETRDYGYPHGYVQYDERAAKAAAGHISDFIVRKFVDQNYQEVLYGW